MGKTPHVPWTARHAWLVVVVWVVLVVAAFPLTIRVTRDLQAQNLDVNGSSAVWADDQLGLVQTTPTAQPTLISGLSASQLSEDASLLRIPATWLDPMSGGTLLLAPSGTSAATVAPLLSRAQAQGGKTTVVSTNTISHTIVHDAETTLRSSAVIAIPVLIILLPLVFGAVTQSLIPLLIALLGSEMALAAVSILEKYMTLSVYLTDITTFLALGVGVDYALFITTRFREALDRGVPVAEAVGEAMQTSGRSVLFSGLAVTLAVSTLFLAGTSYWRGLAVGGAAAVIFVLLLTHTLLPALLRLLGPRLHWGTIRFNMQRWPLWQRLAGWSTWRPWLSVSIGLGLLVLPALLGPSISVTMPANLAAMLPTASPLRVATALEQKIDGPGSISPLPVALQLPTTVQEPATWETVARITTSLAALPDVAQVSSPTRSGASPTALAELASSASSDGQLLSFISPSADPHLVVLVVTAQSGPNANATTGLLSNIQQVLHHDVPPGGRGAVGGAIGVLHDFTQHTDARLPWVIAAAAAVAFVVLLIATGSVTQALLGVLLDGLVALATAGILVLTIQQGHFGLGAEPPNITVTPLIFVLLFGLSMDYEVILLHRIQEALRRGASPRDAAREGIAQTGGMITGAGLLLVDVFLVQLVSPLEILKTLAIGMTAAILLDTWIVRSFLIPGITSLMGRYAFWPWGRRLTSAS